MRKYGHIISSFLLAVFLTALLLSALVLREPLTAAGAAGAIMILLSAVISEKRINES